MDFIEKKCYHYTSWELKTDLKFIRFKVQQSSLNGYKTFTPVIIIGNDILPFTAIEDLEVAKKFITNKYLALKNSQHSPL